MLQTPNWPLTTTCPTCQARYYLSRANIGHRTVCQKCSACFHLLPPADDPPTLAALPSADQENEVINLVGRLWLDLRPGQIVADRYQVVRYLAQGGLSQIFQVCDLEQGRQLALKLPLGSTLDRLPKQTFINEAVAWLKPAPHPNLVTCEGVRIIMKQPIILMEYISGVDLARLMSQGQGDIYQGRPGSMMARLLDTFIQVARGLKYAHSLGLNHLDIKPRNILVERGGRVLIGDYGPLGSALGAAKHQNKNPDQLKLPTCAETRISATRLLGTPQYFSPEVALGCPGAGVGADLWALSLTILECFLGRRPWEMGSVAGKALECYLAEIQPRVILPQPLIDFLKKALAERPEHRHQSASDFEDDLTIVYKQATKRPYLRPESVVETENPARLQMKATALKALGQ